MPMSLPRDHHITRRRFLTTTAMLSASFPLLAACQLAAPAPSATKSPAPAASGARLVNSVGVELPEDAAPLSQQVYRYTHYEGKSLDISRSSYESVHFDTDVCESLVWFDPDNRPVPAAADSWEVSPDGLTWTFHLRRGAKWSDGRPVTVDDWVLSFRRLVDPALTSPHAYMYYGIKNAEAIATGKLADLTQLGVRKVDENTLAVATESPQPTLLQVVGYHPIITPIHMVEKHGEQWASDPATAPSNGPFRYNQWNKGKDFSLVPNPHYNGRYKPRLEKVVLNFVPQVNPQVLQMYKADEIDVIYELQSNADLTAATADAELKNQLYTFPAYVTFYMFFNTNKPPFNNLLIRQAFSHAIDRTALTDQVMRKLGAPAYSMLPNGFPCSQNADPQIQAIQSYNPDLARKLLADAGYPNGQGFPTLDLMTRQGQYVTEAEAVQNMLKTTLGVTVQVRDVERALYMDMLAKHQITLGIVQWKWDWVDAGNFLQWWATQSRHTWKNEKYNELIDKAKTELDDAKRCALFRSAERILIEDVGAVFLGFPLWATLYKPWVAGMRKDSSGVPILYKFETCDVYIRKH